MSTARISSQGLRNLSKSVYTNPTTLTKESSIHKQPHFLSPTVWKSVPRRFPRNLFAESTILPRHVYGGEVPPIEYEYVPDSVRSEIPLHPDQAKQLPHYYSQYISGYIYTSIPNVEAVRKELYEVLEKLLVVGRIYINTDGMNVQMSCHPSVSIDAVEAIRSVHGGIFGSMRLFMNEIINTNETKPLFNKLQIKKKVILNDGLETSVSSTLDAKMEDFSHLTPEQWHTQLSQHKDNSIILDVRNMYEYEVGSFVNALPVDVPAYRDTIPELDRLLGISDNSEYKVHNPLKPSIEELAHSSGANGPVVSDPKQPVDKNTKLFIYCTGGIRCLKVGAYLAKQGFTDVNTLEGGINAYNQYILAQSKSASISPLISPSNLNNTGKIESLYKGVNVVFDDRRGVRVTDDVLSTCYYCNTKCDRVRNCSCGKCDVLIIQCRDCESVYNGACSVQCNTVQYGRGKEVRQAIIKHNTTAKTLQNTPVYTNVYANANTNNTNTNTNAYTNTTIPYEYRTIKLVPASPGHNSLRPRVTPITRPIPKNPIYQS